jgi:hypothetical protein
MENVKFTGTCSLNLWLVIKIITTQIHGAYNQYLKSGIKYGEYSVIYRSRGQGSIPGATRFSEKPWVWNGFHSSS